MVLLAFSSDSNNNLCMLRKYLSNSFTLFITFVVAARHLARSPMSRPSRTVSVEEGEGQNYYCKKDCLCVFHQVEVEVGVATPSLPHKCVTSEIK